MIIAIEGIDGAGKNTLVRALKQAAPMPVTTLQFPRYEQSIYAQLAQDALYGRMGDLTDSVYGMATLFALDRQAALPDLLPFVDSPELLILDRYIASNAAYSAARAQDPAVIDWVEQLEVERLGLPRPDLQILLQTPFELAQQRAQSREASDASRVRDRYETDSGLQERTASYYSQLAAQNWLGKWMTADPDVAPQEAAAGIFAALGEV